MYRKIISTLSSHGPSRTQHSLWQDCRKRHHVPTRESKSWSGSRAIGAATGRQVTCSTCTERMLMRTGSRARPGRSTCMYASGCRSSAALAQTCGQHSSAVRWSCAEPLDRNTRHSVASVSVKPLEQPLRHARAESPTRLRARRARV